jgi:hypothetical protein
MKKQTSVEWFIEQVTKNNILAIDAIPQAIKMEKQNVIDVLEDALFDENDRIDFDDPNYRKYIIDYILNKINQLKKELQK